MNEIRWVARKFPRVRELTIRDHKHIKVVKTYKDYLYCQVNLRFIQHRPKEYSLLYKGTSWE